MNVLVFTSLYPNNVWPNHGVFIKECMTRVACVPGCHVKVIAPVPYTPPFTFGARRQFIQVVKSESREGLATFHPRYFITPKVGMVFYGYTMFLSLLSYLKRFQKDFAFDVIDSHFVYPDGMAAVLLGRYFRKPVIVSALGSDINVYKNLLFVRSLLRWTLVHATRVTAVSEALRKAMVAIGVPAERITVIPNGVDGKKFFPTSKAEARRLVRLPDGPVLLSVGHLTENKGFDLLVRAVKKLQEQGEKSLSLVIIGEGIFRPELERVISSLELGSQVRLVGAIPHADLQRWYNAADLFCLMSAREGWPNVVMESLACGTPVLATAVGGIPEILRSELVGSFTKREVGEIAQSLVRALRQPWQQKEIAQYAQRYTWELTASAVVKVLQEALKAHEGNQHRSIRGGC